MYYILISASNILILRPIDRYSDAIYNPFVSTIYNYEFSMRNVHALLKMHIITFSIH